MTIVYFVIAALALAGAAVLLWLDRQRSTEKRHHRAVWGDRHGFAYRESDTKLRKVFRRAAMDVPDHVTVRDVAYGTYEDAEAVVFDLSETATVIAVRRTAPSPVIVDLRHEDVLAPAEDDVELLGAMGPRVMFSNDLDVARRVCDRRMIALATNAPPFVEILWTEGKWAIGSMPLTADDAKLDAALDVVRRFADLLRALPPVRDPQGSPDPRDPHGPARAELADEKTENMRDKQRGAALRKSAHEQSATRGEADSVADAQSEEPTAVWAAVPPTVNRAARSDSLDDAAARTRVPGPSTNTAGRRMGPMPVQRPADRSRRDDR
ncbi:hypothetical protein HH308_20670 [Gordonia sp. TBRC 11910]|uniref:Secreted protein n=1 Tax=Gordonia asplenii TaxID=2725283 RepID=A0A848L4V9_9ACTN|nr:hypothetical protein [Gordonia asplenii]NMO03633.1 hypothetical protein [Gordonia asplenii]